MKTLKPFVFFALAASLFCLTRSVHAGTWKLSYQCQGTYQYPRGGSASWPTDPSTYTLGDGSADFWMDPIIRGLFTATESNSGTITATFTWVPSSAGDVPPATTLNVIETANAEIYLDDYNSDAGPLSGDAEDGLDDTPITSEFQVQSQGIHPVAIPIVFSNGQYTATLSTRNLSTSGTISDTTDTESYDGSFPNHSYLYTDINYKAALAHAVTISSTIDPTYHKDAATGQPVQNQYDANGTMKADSVQVGDISGGAITYSANVLGNWTADSSYNWYSAATDQSGSGTFTMPSDPPYGLDVPYNNNTNFSNQEHINIHCIDAGDGTGATANYYVNWHNDLDGWITLVDTRVDDQSVRVTMVYHPIEPAKFSDEVETKITETVKATGDVDAAKLAAKFGVEIGAEYENSNKLTLEYELVPNKYNWIERQPFHQHREGTVDMYGFHGYEGLSHWQLDSVYHPGSPLIDVVESQHESDSVPSY